MTIVLFQLHILVVLSRIKSKLSQRKYNDTHLTSLSCCSAWPDHRRVRGRGAGEAQIPAGGRWLRGRTEGGGRQLARARSHGSHAPVRAVKRRCGRGSRCRVIFSPSPTRPAADPSRDVITHVM